MQASLKDLLIRADSDKSLKLLVKVWDTPTSHTGQVMTRDRLLQILAYVSQSLPYIDGQRGSISSVMIAYGLKKKLAKHILQKHRLIKRVVHKH